MKGFKLNDSGDVVLAKNDIGIVEGSELIRQTVQTVLSTNKNEWSFNNDEGIYFKKIIVKNPDMDLIKNEIVEGLKQVDETFVLTEFSYLVKSRNLLINFSAVNSNGETISSSLSY